MATVAQAQQLARTGRQREAVALVEQAARSGDPHALFMCANWRLFGHYGPRDVAATHDMLRAAAERGHAEAIKLSAILIGNGTGVAADPERAKLMLEGIAARDPDTAWQLSVLSGMLAPDFPGQSLEQLSEQPSIRLIRGLLLGEECDYVRRRAEPALLPSMIVDPETKRPVPNPVRNSTGMNFGPWSEDLVIHVLNQRLAKASGTEVGWGEPLHVLRYAGGQEFKPHLDALPGATNQRRWTVLVYLNEDYTGGETLFPRLGLRIRGRTGDALIFENVGPDGRSDERTRHAGSAVVSGVKWLASRWIRGAPISPWDSM